MINIRTAEQHSRQQPAATLIEVVESTGSADLIAKFAGDGPMPPTSLATLEEVLAGADRLAVIDVETTGLYRSDRIVEIAIVTIDRTGRVIDEFDTLVNPFRDPGPAWLHGVTATMLVDAPGFDDIADHVAARLNGAVVVAHNLRFDSRMVGQELSHAGIDVDWGAGLDTLYATGYKLEVACAKYGIRNEGAHRALFDARATGQLLMAVANTFTSNCRPAVARPLQAATQCRILTRDGFATVVADTPYLRFT
jgi:DNA polymerase-3 subunit epsilon